MKIKLISILIFLFLINSCSKSSNDMATETAVDSASFEADSPSSVNVDEKNNPEVIDVPVKESAEAPQTVDDIRVTAATQESRQKLKAKRDTIQVAFNKINPNLLNKNTEIIKTKIPGKIIQNENNGTPAQPPLITAPPTEVEKPRNAVLGFSYFPQIPLNEERDLRVFVKIEGDGKKVAQKLKDYEKEDLEFAKTNDSSIVCIVKNIEAFRKLSIKPFYDYEDFRITKVDDGLENLSNKDPNEQVLDFVNGNYWHWKVKAIAKSAHVGTVTLIINAETPEGQKLQLAERQIKIKIGIDKPIPTFWEKVSAFFDAHFKEILSLVIIPLALYLFNILRKKYLAKKEESTDVQNPEKKS